MRKIILVSGYPAAGKSTFARRLSEHLQIPCFNKDTIKEALADGFGPSSQEAYNKGSAATFNIMAHIAECLLQVSKPCILESNFRVQEGERIEELLEKHGASCLTFVFTGDLDVLYNRYAKRARERHWVHRGPGDRDDFKDGLARHKAGHIHIRAGEIVTVDTTDFDKIDYGALFDLAKRFIQNHIPHLHLHHPNPH